MWVWNWGWDLADLVADWGVKLGFPLFVDLPHSDPGSDGAGDEANMKFWSKSKFLASASCAHIYTLYRVADGRFVSREMDNGNSSKFVDLGDLEDLGTWKDLEGL